VGKDHGLAPAAEAELGQQVAHVRLDRRLLHREFTHVRRVARFWNGLGVADDEQGVPVFLAAGLRSSWARAWAAFRDYA
jgi:hypothetical protein